MKSILEPQPPEALRTPEAPRAHPLDSALEIARTESSRPLQKEPYWIGLSGLAGFVTAWFLAASIEGLQGLTLVPLFLACTAAPMILLSLAVYKTHRMPSSGLNAKAPTDWPRIVVKLTGLGITLLAVFICYWLFPEYHRGHYFPVWNALTMMCIPLLAIIACVFIYTDKRMQNPHDGYWQAGLLALGRWKLINRAALKQYALSWLVKGFFLPFMLAGAFGCLSSLIASGVDFSTINTLYSTGVNFIFALDITFGAVGYLLTLRLLNSHIRSTESTWGGWLCTIVCYVPFSTFLWESFLKYKGPTSWYDALQSYPLLYVSWGFAILMLLGIYVWSTISFGCRFSNLTNRGVIRHGPYTFMKHPAYVAKNLAWWFISVPFLANHTWEGCLRASICLLLTNLIYALRAKTEERHMMQDPEYRTYSDWIDRHGAYAQLKRLFQRATK